MDGMTELMSQALRQSLQTWRRGLHTHSGQRRLYRFYENLGFSPAFHINLERYRQPHTSPTRQYTATD